IDSLPTLPLMIYTVLIAFLLSSLIGITYTKTFRGLSYSRNYVQAVILGSIVAATVMHAIGDSLARGLGMIGALAIIRFRTSFKDSRDILFMFSSLAAGIACGVGAFTVAIVGTGGFVMTAILLFFTPLGQTSYYDGMLRFNISKDDENLHELESVLRTYCKTFALVTLRELKQDDRLEHAYHVKIRRKKRKEDMINALSAKISSIKGMSLMLQETTVEL
ncbi:MAG: DUF4956 domain-containing protein, partial [Candidatus Electryoneaceae bacterium]|nr:DUF4956 domain-containing protein [Candidatus Electryoneaceae bacterium]